MDGITLGAVGVLLLATLAAAGAWYWKARSGPSRRSRKSDPIPLAFAFDAPAPQEFARNDLPGGRGSIVVAPPSRVLPEYSKPEVKPGSPRQSATAAGPRSNVVTAQSPGRTRAIPEPLSLDEPPPRDVPARRGNRENRKTPAPDVAQTDVAAAPVRSPQKQTPRMVASPVLSTPASAYTVEDLAADNIHVVEGKTIVFHRPTPGTMRLLPGRLEVEAGEDGPAEIRFVDIPGAQPEVTFGRRRGEPFRHVQLRSLTVSREHARLAREGKDWVISNLSLTNPIIVNGVTLSSTDDKRVLHEGDRIEMGEVVFRYRGG